MQEAAVGKIVSGTAFGCPDAGINFNFGMGRKSAKEFIGNAVKTGFLRSGNLQADVIEKFDVQSTASKNREVERLPLPGNSGGF